MRAACLLALATLVAASPAYPHAALERAVPPVGSELAVAPKQILLTFTESVEPAFSTIEVSNAAGSRVDVGLPHTAANDATQLIVDLPTLAPGTYNVVWHVTSTDTHKTQGSFRFTIKP